MLSSMARPEPAEVEKHLHTLLEGPFALAETQKAILCYVVGRALKGERVTGVDIAHEVFDNTDTRTEIKVKTANRNIKAKLAKYYEEEGMCESIRIVFTERGYNPAFVCAPKRRREASATHSNLRWSDRLRRTAFGWSDDLSTFFKAFASRTALEAGFTPRRLFDEVFAPAYKDLRSVHANYVKIFVSAKRALSGRVDAALLKQVADRLSQDRIEFEALRTELRFLFAGVIMSSSTHPACNQFVQLAYVYVAPPNRRGTTAFGLVYSLNATLASVGVDTHAGSLQHVREDVDEALESVTSLFGQIRDAYVAMKRSTVPDHQGITPD